MDDITKTKIMKLAIELFEDNHETEQIINSISELYPKDLTTTIGFVIKHAIEMYKSLIESIDKCGGSIVVPIEKLWKITIIDLISNLATNGIRFTFKHKEK